MKNLLGRLMSRPFEELKAIAEAWGTVTRDPDPTHNDLAIAVYHTMVEKPSVRGVWSALEQETKEVVLWLLGQRNMLAILDDVPAQLGRPPEEVFPAVERARRAGLVDVDEVLVRGSRVVSSGDNLYAWAPKSTVEAVRRRVVSVAAEAAKVLREVVEESRCPAPLEEPFSGLLNTLEQEEIRAIATSWRLPDVHRYSKQELVGVMSEFVATPRSRDTLLESLPERSRALFAYLAEKSSSTTPETKSHFNWEERDLRAALLPLVQRALAWDVMEGETRTLFIPHDLLASGNGQSRAAPFQPKLPASAPYSVDVRLSYQMPWDLLTLLGIASRQDLGLTLQEQRITKRVARKINESLTQPDDMKAGSDYVDALVHFAQCMGLLTTSGGEHPALQASAKVDGWAKLSFEVQRQRLCGFWQEDRKWTEPAAYGTIYWWNSDLTYARKRLTAYLHELPVGQWVSLDAFLRHIHTLEPFIIWSQEELVRRFGLRALQGFRSQWFDIEGRILADMLRTMLNWLGAVDIGRDKQKRFLSFRVTEAGTRLFSSAPNNEWAPAQGKSLLVQPTFEVLVIHPESPPVWGVIRAAELVRHDRVSAYVLTRESVVRAVESGMSDDEICALLAAHADKGLPQNVEHSIRDWTRRIKRVELHSAALIEVADPAILDELAASRKTKRYIQRRLSPTIAIAAFPDVDDSSGEEPVARLMRELRASGFYPRLTPAHPARAAEKPVVRRGRKPKSASLEALPEPAKTGTDAR